MNSRRRFALACASGWFLLAALPLPAGTRQYDFQQKTLPNGLRVITLEDFTCPVVAVQVWYHVGSKNEDPQRQGFAHMFEHMMFRGTDRLGSKDHFEFIRRTGGDCNAFTAFDNTTYINELPSNQLEMILWLEAERMAFLKIDDESFYTERKVVEEERRLGMNRPYGTVPEKLLAGIFKQHPYRWTPIGSIPHLRAATIDELEAFWSKFYVPNNATLVIVGAVKHADAQGLAEKYFGWIPRCPDPARDYPKEPPQTAPAELKIEEKKGPVPVVGIAYRTVPENHADQTALEILMSVVGGGESSRIYHDLVKEKRLCQVALGGAFALEDDGFAGAGAVMLPVIEDKEKVLKAIAEHLQKVIDEPITQRELDKVKNQMLRGVVTGALTVANKANLLGSAALIYQDPERVNTRIDEIRAVTIADVQRVAKKYLVPERRTIVRVEPNMGGMLKGLFGGKGPEEDEGAAPASKPTTIRVAARTGAKAKAERPKDFPAKPPMQALLEEIPKVEHAEKTLSNGLKVVVIPNHEVPYVTMTLGLKCGAWAEDPAKPGVANMALAMLTKGTKKHTAAKLAEELEFNALSLGGGAGMDTASVNASCVSDKFELAAQYLAEVVLEPTFPDDEFKILKKQTQMGLMISEKEPGYIADKELRKRLFGSHPYARTVVGESADLSRIKTRDLAKWWSTYARPDAAVMYVAGDVKPDATFALIEKTLGGWKKPDSPTPMPQLPSTASTAATHIFLVDRPDSVQSQIRVGHLSLTREHPDYHPSRVVSQILGGGFNSRLNEAVRVKKGLTYGARGGFSTERFAGQFSASTFSKTPNTAEALQVVLDELKRMRDTEPTAEELDISRSYLTGSFAGQRETPQATVGDLWLIEYAGLPADYFSRAMAGWKKTTAADVKRVAAEQIQMDKLSIVVVGDAKKVQADLEKIAPVTVVRPVETEAEPDKS